MGLRGAIGGDLRRGAVLALFGCALVLPVDYLATVIAYPGDASAGALLRLPLLDATLLALAWVPLALLLGGVGALARLAVPGERQDSWPGLFAAGGGDRTRLTPAVPWLLAGLIGSALFVTASTVLIYELHRRFKEPVLTAALLALIHLGLVAAIGTAGWALAVGLRAAGRALQPHLGALNPLGRLVPAAALGVVVAIPGVLVFLHLVPQARHLVPWRHVLAAVSFAAGAYLGALFLTRRGRLLPAEPRRRRLTLAVTVVASLAIAAITLTRVGAHAATKSMAVTGSPTMARMIDLVRWLNDFDGDGFGSLLGENDCGPFDPDIHVGAPDIPDDGIDQNCDGHDFSLSRLPTYHKGQRMEVPADYLRDWNFLLITIDTVRADHTTMGGYTRDTTPNLAALARRSVWFSFANAPSAGTMASVPAIMTSKFFHSGIALDENVKRGMPPRLKPQNTLLSELLQDKGWHTGAILSHEYFNDWGLEQGFDTYDNEIGHAHNPRQVTSADVTDRALAWIGKQGDSRWFLWLHYVDPHGDYVPHPDDVSYGDAEMDTYDGEIHYTDKHIGRLLDELDRLPGANRTVIFVTSDHGDAFGEHGGHHAHGDTLYHELLRVPLIAYVPDAPARIDGGVVSNLDIFPTICDLAGIDTNGLGLEGESLIPQILYRRDNPDRVVFAETNWPKRQRAAITDKYKLIFRLEDHLYELYDLSRDPQELHKISSSDAAGFAEMKGYLDDWMERVFYSRDLEMNQAAGVNKDFLLDRPPAPQHRSEVSFDGGRIEVLGIDTDKAAYGPGERIAISVYFHVVTRPSGDFKIQVEGWLDTTAGAAAGARSQLRYTNKGLLPTSRWRDGEFVRDRFAITLPPGWRQGSTVRIGLRMAGSDGKPLEVHGPTRPEVPDLAVLAEVGFTAPAGMPEPGPPPGPPGKPRPAPPRPPLPGKP